MLFFRVECFFFLKKPISFAKKFLVVKDCFLVVGVNEIFFATFITVLFLKAGWRFFFNISLYTLCLAVC